MRITREQIRILKPSNEATKSNACLSLLFGKSDVIVRKSLVMDIHDCDVDTVVDHSQF